MAWNLLTALRMVLGDECEQQQQWSRGRRRHRSCDSTQDNAILQYFIYWLVLRGMWVCKQKSGIVHGGKLNATGEKKREKLKSLQFFIHVYFSDEIFKRIWDKSVGNLKFKFF
jgi:hypothetical protein